MDDAQSTGMAEDVILPNGLTMDEDIERSFFSDLAVLCSERLSQMTRTYDDLDAIKQSLEEKEKDLELAATIGKSLLERNKELQQTNEFLEEQLNHASDQVTQLKHELQQKIDLLHIYTDNESADSGGSTPATEWVASWGLLQRKIRILEEENVALKLETNHLKTLTQGLEEKEQQLLTDYMKQIADSKCHNEILGAELVEKQEQCEKQQKQLSRLLKEMVDKSNNEKLLRCENEELAVKLLATQETQAELAQELHDLQGRYAEVIAMLTESKEELRLMKEKATSSRFGSSGPDDSLYDSLASELEASDSGYSGGGRNRYYGIENEAKNETLRRQSQDKLIKVMETVRNSLQKQELKAEKQKELDGSLTVPPLVVSTPSSTIGHASPNVESDCDAFSPRSAASKAKGLVKEVEVGLSPTCERISRAPSNESLCSYPGPGLGVPGIPGTKDLEFAIQRLSLRRRVEMEFARYRSEKGLAPSPASYRMSPRGFHCPSTAAVSVKASASSHCMDTTPKSGIPRRQFSVPVPLRSRLMLVKSVEGSDTMAHWKELATPGGIDSSSWEKRPGIKVKGGNGGSPPLASGVSGAIPCTSSPTHCAQATVPVSDMTFSELDNSVPVTSTCAEPYSSIGRQLHSTPGTYSFVNSQILHPRDEACALSTACSAPSSTSNLSSSPPRDDGTATFSTALNLAQALGERCVDLVGGISGGWWTRQSPMTVPLLSAGLIPDVTSKAETTLTHSRELTAKTEMISGLESLMEEDGPIVGLDQVKAVEKSPAKRRGTSVGGVITRADLERTLCVKSVQFLWRLGKAKGASRTPGGATSAR